MDYEERLKEEVEEINTSSVFIDFKQAFNNLNRKKLWNFFENINVLNKLNRIVEMTMQDSQATINTEREKKINTGVP